jgi:hypothetical protein
VFMVWYLIKQRDNFAFTFTFTFTSNFKSQDNSVGIATGYGLDDRMSGVRLPAGGGGWEFFSSTPCPERLWGPPSLLSNG